MWHGYCGIILGCAARAATGNERFPVEHEDVRPLALTGDAANADPVCAESPRHGDVQAIVMHAHQEQARDDGVWQPAQRIVFRSDANSRKAGVS
jgi:hypothetical protein